MHQQVEKKYDNSVGYLALTEKTMQAQLAVRTWSTSVTAWLESR